MAGEAAFHHMEQTRTQGFELDGVDDVGHERLHEHAAGDGEGYAARLHIEEGRGRRS